MRSNLAFPPHKETRSWAICTGKSQSSVEWTTRTGSGKPPRAARRSRTRRIDRKISLPRRALVFEIESGSGSATTGSIGSREIADGSHGFDSPNFGAMTDRMGAATRRRSWRSRATNW